MKIHVLIIYVTSIFRHSTGWNLKNRKLFEITWTVTSCIYCSSRFLSPLSFLRKVKLFGLNLPIGRSVQLISCSILSQGKDLLSLYEISNDKDINLDFVVGTNLYKRRKIIRFCTIFTIDSNIEVDDDSILLKKNIFFLLFRSIPTSKSIVSILFKNKSFFLLFRSISTCKSIVSILLKKNIFSFI